MAYRVEDKHLIQIDSVTGLSAKCDATEFTLLDVAIKRTISGRKSNTGNVCSVEINIWNVSALS